MDCSLGKFVADALDLVFEGAVLRHLSLDNVNGGKNGRVVSAEDLRDILQGEGCHAADHVDRDVTRKRDLIRAFFTLDVLHGDVIPL